MAGKTGIRSASIARPQQQTCKSRTLPGPTQGMNSTGALYGMNESEALYSYNLIPSEFGPRTRIGYQEWANGMTGDGIRTIIPFDGDDSDHVSDKLFAVTNTDIWDVTVKGPAVSKLVFLDQGAEAGWGHFTHYVNDAGADFLMAAFDLNGLFEYDPDLDTWAAVIDITYPAADPTESTDIVFIVSHKQRLWLVPQASSHAYYLPINSKSGQATRFDFGNKFKHGGELVGLYNWTIDGGDGVDDYLVAVSGGGDIIMYRGEDPAQAATWATTGTWYVGELPSGRRGVSEVGGDLWILSTQGLVTAQSLVTGVYSEDHSQSPAFKIARLIRTRMYQEKNLRGWEVELNANEAQFVINSPTAANQPDIQYVYSIPMNAWGMWRGVPALTFGNWNGRFFIGGEGDSPLLYEMIGDLDNVLLTPLDDGTDNVPIEFSVLGTYQDFSEQGLFKIGQYIRPSFLGTSAPLYDIKLLYDYDIAEPPLVPGIPAQGVALWDTASWDLAVWGGEVNAYTETEGAGGMGLVMAYAIRGTASSRATLAAVDVMWSSGGLV